MKIGMVCYPTYGGSGIVATELGIQLAKNGHEVHFISYAPPQRLDKYQDNLYYHAVEFPHYPLFEFHLYSLALASKIIDVVRFEKLDIVHVHYAIPHAISAFLAKEVIYKEYHTKIITTLHGTDVTLVGLEPAFQPLVQLSLEKTDAITAVSEYLSRKTIEEFHPNKKINVIPNFIDPDYYKRQEYHILKKQIAPNGEKIIIHISNFRPVKRVVDAVKSFIEINKAIPSKMLLVGDGPDRSEAEKIVMQNKLTDKVRFLGKQLSIIELLSISDLMIFPSELESFGLAALEAMSCGVPVIAYDINGLEELLINGYNGIKVELKNIQKLSEMSIKVLKDKKLWKILSDNSIKIANEKYHVNKIIPMYENLYKSVLNP